MLIHNGSVLRFLPLGRGAMSFAVASSLYSRASDLPALEGSVMIATYRRQA